MKLVSVTHCRPILSNLRQCQTQIRNEWVREARYLGEWLDQGLKTLTEPKRRRGFAGQGQAIRDPTVAVHSHQELSGSEDGLHTTD